MSTRSIGGLISSHSDNKGLIIPPRMSEYKAVVLPVYKGQNQAEINAYAEVVSRWAI